MAPSEGLRLLREDGEAASGQAGLEKLEGARVLITGASGLIGLSLLATVAAARQAGVSAEIFAGISQRPSAAFSEIARWANARVVRSDLSAAQGFDGLPEADVVVHAAGSGDPGVFGSHKAETLSLGACATLALVRRLPSDGRLLFLSSSEVYQGLGDQPADESMCGTTTPQHPRAAYIEAKRAGEAACSIGRERGLGVTVARLAMTYGPGAAQGDTRVVNALVERCLSSSSTQLVDSGSAVRTLLYTRDAAELLWRVALQGVHAVYNVAGQTVTSIREMADLVAEKTDSQVMSGGGESVLGAAREVRVNIDRVLREFPKSDFITLDDGIARTVSWYRWLLGEGGRR